MYLTVATQFDQLCLFQRTQAVYTHIIFLSSLFDISSV